MRYGFDAMAGGSDEVRLARLGDTSTELGHLGVSASLLGQEEGSLATGMVPPSAEGMKFSYTFEDIISPHLYLGREHMEQFRVKYMPEESPAQIAQAFALLLDPIGPPKRIGDPRPKFSAKDLGLVVVDRESQNFTLLPHKFAPNPANRDSISRLVQVYGAVKFIDGLKVPDFRMKFDLMKSEDSVRYRILSTLGLTLKQQIKD
jgi:hypothetical protein